MYTLYSRTVAIKRFVCPPPYNTRGQKDRQCQAVEGPAFKLSVEPRVSATLQSLDKIQGHSAHQCSKLVHLYVCI